MLGTLLIASTLFAAPVFEVESLTKWPGTKKHKGVAVGGISGVAPHEGKFYLISDDRGSKGPPRFYRARFEKTEMVLEAALPIQGLKDFFRDRVILDPEGIAVLSSGLVISSEADTAKKPRQLNRLLLTDFAGKLKGEIALPPDVQPELTGQQTRGSANNFGPEGLSLSPSGKVLWVGFERPIMVAGEREKAVRFLAYRQEKERFVFDRFHHYQMDEAIEGDREILRGVSEILALNDHDFLVIERSARLAGLGLSYGGGLFRASCAEKVCKKVKILDFVRDLAKTFPDGAVPNFEGMTFLDDDRKRLLIISDNNFSTSTESMFLVLKFKESP